MPAPNRDLTIVKPTNYTARTYNASGILLSTVGPVSLGNVTTLRDRKLATSVKTPGYGSLKRSKLPLNPYYKHDFYVRSDIGIFAQRARQNASPNNYIEYTYNTNTDYILGNAFIRPPQYEADDPTQKAIAKLIDQIKIQKSSTAVSIAEFHKTVRLVADSATKIFNSIRAIKSGRFGDAAAALGFKAKPAELRRLRREYAFMLDGYGLTAQQISKRAFAAYKGQDRFTDFCSSAWLSYRYGWRPLLKDIHDTAEALAQYLDDHDYRTIRVSARAKSGRHTNKILPGNHYREKVNCVSNIWVEYVLWYRIKAGTINTANTFGLTNPLAVAWELVPFSFVADWFIPIGSAIEGISAYSGLEFHSGTKSTLDVYTRTREIVHGLPYSTGGYTYTMTTAAIKDSWNALSLNREKLTTFPSYGWPKFKDPRKVTNAISAIALLQSLFLREKR